MKIVESIKKLDKQKRDALVLIILCVFVIILSALFVFADFGNKGISEFISAGPFDTQFFYDGEQVYESLSEMTVEQIKACLVYHIVDYLYVVVYFLFFVSAGLIYITDKRFRKLAYILPCTIIFFDIFENVFLDAIMMSYNIAQKQMVGFATTAGVMTLLKTIFLILTALIYLVFIVIWVVRRVKATKQAKSVATANGETLEACAEAMQNIATDSKTVQSDAIFEENVGENIENDEATEQIDVTEETAPEDTANEDSEG